MKLYVFDKWNSHKKTFRLDEWDTDEDIFKKEIAKIKNGNIVIDVGSEYGFYAITAGQLVGSEGKVLAIEAHPETYKLLLMNIKMHKLSDRIIPICKAAGKSSGKVKIYETISPGSTSIFRQSVYKLNKNRFYLWINFLRSGAFLKIILKRFTSSGYTVKMDTLDNIVRQYII